VASEVAIAIAIVITTAIVAADIASASTISTNELEKYSYLAWAVYLLSQEEVAI
jgi:hypothetical protein